MLTAESKVARTEVADPPNADLNCSWKQLVEPVEPFLQTVSQRLIQQVHEFDPQIIPYAKYVLNSSGKHLRPTLVALASRVCGAGKITDAHVTAAVIIEMVHLATLGA